MIDLDIRRVRYFLRLSETLNFSRTARDFGVSQPALTKAVKRLEETVGGALIRREGLNTHLTPLGNKMLEQFRELDASASRVEYAARRLVHGDMPQIQIGIMCTVGPQPLAAFLAGYKRSKPKLEIVCRDLARSELAKVLLSGAVDVAVVEATVSDEQRFRYIELYSEPMVVVCAADHAFAARDAVSFSDVLRQPYVDRLQCEFRDTFLSESRRLEFEPSFAARADREDWSQALIRDGVGVAIMPKRSIVLSDLVSVPLADLPLTRTVSVAVPIGREDTETVRDILSAVRRYAW